MSNGLLANNVAERLGDAPLACGAPLTLKQRAKAFVESSVVYQYPKGGWRGESPPNPEEDFHRCWCRDLNLKRPHVRTCWWKNIERVEHWEPLHDMPEHLWLQERRLQWHPRAVRKFDDKGNRLPLSDWDDVTTWHGGWSRRVWKIRVLDIPGTVGWLAGVGCVNKWAVFFADGTPCPYLAGPWQYVPVSSHRQAQFGAHIIHSTRWEAAFAVISGLIDAYGPHSRRVNR